LFRVLPNRFQEIVAAASGAIVNDNKGFVDQSEQ